MSSNNGSRELSLDDIMSAEDIVVEKVPMPEWGGHVFMRSPTPNVKDKQEERWQRSRNGGSLVGVRAQLVADCLCDSSGKLLNPNPAQIAKLGSEKNGKAFDRLFLVAQRLGGWTDDEVERAEGNSEAVPTNGSG